MALNSWIAPVFLAFLTASAVAADAPDNIKFPARCGKYVLRGFLQKEPWRITLWKDSDRQSEVRIEGACPRCRFFDKLFVKAEVDIFELKPPSARIASIVAAVETEHFDGPDAAKLKKSSTCAK